MEFRCAYSLNTRNESVCIQRISRMNLFIYREKKIRGMKLYVYWEYAKCTKMWIPWRIRYQNRNILGHLSGAQMGSFGQTTSNQNISCKSTFKCCQRVYHTLQSSDRLRASKHIFADMGPFMSLFHNALYPCICI